MRRCPVEGGSVKTIRAICVSRALVFVFSVNADKESCVTLALAFVFSVKASNSVCVSLLAAILAYDLEQYFTSVYTSYGKSGTGAVQCEDVFRVGIS